MMVVVLLAASGGSASVAQVSDSGNDATVIDILFVYSKQTAEKWGNRLRPRVEEMVDRTSVMMLNSGANARLRLVGVEPAPAYVDLVEAEVQDPEADPRTFRRLVPPWCDTRVPDDCGVTSRLKEEFGADMLYVLLEMDVERVCGVAMLPLTLGALSRGISYQGAISTGDLFSCMRGYILAHMVGHNLGLQHNPGGNFSLGHCPHNVHDPIFPGGYGFFKQTRSDGEGYETIMSTGGGSLVPEWRFSTSRERYNGRVIGLPGQHEASDALRRAAPYVAAYKPDKHVDAVRFPCTRTVDSDCMARGRFSVRVSFRTRAGLWRRARIVDASWGTRLDCSTSSLRTTRSCC